jgi:hypothetical protein
MDDDQEIAERARALWQQAGEPKGQENYFRNEAERQLKEERMRRELKVPDNL